MRKAALVLAEIEKRLMGHFSSPVEGTELETSIFRYSYGLAKLLADEKEATELVRSAAVFLSVSCEREFGGTELSQEELARAIDTLRHALLAATGQAPADWDLIDPSTGLLDPSSRHVFPGIKVYLEDLRSPFNVGSIFRTADAFSLEELILSPACADPLHPRAKRSAMGATALLPWRRAALEDLAGDAFCFALELGGEPIETFSFPVKGLAILGSEELGISREARELCTHGTVSIPMAGAKGSLNVAVAFGILMYAWTRSIQGN